MLSRQALAELLCAWKQQRRASGVHSWVSLDPGPSHMLIPYSRGQRWSHDEPLASRGKVATWRGKVAPRGSLRGKSWRKGPTPGWEGGGISTGDVQKAEVRVKWWEEAFLPTGLIWNLSHHPKVFLFHFPSSLICASLLLLSPCSLTTDSGQNRKSFDHTAWGPTFRRKFVSASSCSEQAWHHMLSIHPC